MCTQPPLGRLWCGQCRWTCMVAAEQVVGLEVAAAAGEAEAAVGAVMAISPVASTSLQ